MSGNRPRAPSFIAPLLDFDEKLSKSIYTWLSKSSHLDLIKANLKSLEISCHGIPWLFISLVSTWLLSSDGIRAFFFNLFIALIIDIIAVGALKAFIRRRRPAYDPGEAAPTFAVDKFSFPSGHASRSTLIALLVLFLSDFFFLIDAVVLAWALAVMLSRILIGRHYVADVLGGFFLGIIEFFLCSVIWVSQEKAISFINWLSDEKSSGPSYDI